MSRVCPDPIQLFIVFAQRAALLQRPVPMRIKLRQTWKQKPVAVMRLSF